MAITYIKEIDEKINDKGEILKIVRFDFDNKLRFTYLTQKSLQYWADRGVSELKIGDKINVFEVPNTKFYKIVSINDK